LISHENVISIYKLKLRDKFSNLRISDELGINRETVARYLKYQSLDRALEAFESRFRDKYRKLQKDDLRIIRHAIYKETYLDEKINVRDLYSSLNKDQINVRQLYNVLKKEKKSWQKTETGWFCESFIELVDRVLSDEYIKSKYSIEYKGGKGSYKNDLKINLLNSSLPLSSFEINSTHEYSFCSDQSSSKQSLEESAREIAQNISDYIIEKSYKKNYAQWKYQKRYIKEILSVLNTPNLIIRDEKLLYILITNILIKFATKYVKSCNSSYKATFSYDGNLDSIKSLKRGRGCDLFCSDNLHCKFNVCENYYGVEKIFEDKFIKAFRNKMFK
jgi:hypothetical protein